MYPPTEPPLDPLGLPPAPSAPAAPAPVQPASMPTGARVILTALAALAGPGRGTGLLQGMQLADQTARQRAMQDNALAQQDYQRQHLAFQDEQRAYQAQQEQRAARLKQMLDSFQTELASTPDDTSAENLYTAAGQAFQAMGFRGFDVDSLKRKYKSPSMVDRAAKVFNKWSDNPQIKERLKSDPESLRDFTIGDVGGVPMTFGQYAELAHYAMLPPQPKEPPKPPAVGTFEDYVTRTYGANPTSAQILDARKAYNTADNAPPQPREPRDKVQVWRNGNKIWIEPGTEQLGDEKVSNQPEGLTPTQSANARALADDFVRDSKEFISRAQSYATISTIGRKKPTPAGDISLIFAYMKMLDPGSTVREGEQATARNAAAVPDYVRNMYNKVIGGLSLTPQQRTDFVGRARDIYSTSKRMQDATTSTYTDRATRMGIDPSLVVRDYSVGVEEDDPRRKEIEAKIEKLNQQRQGPK